MTASRIDGDFDGHDAGREFHLQNGQVWKQVSPESRYARSTSPEVYLIPTSRGHLLWVGGAGEFVQVERLR